MPRPISRPSKLTAEERRLREQQEELRRREAELQRALKTLPAKIEERKAKEKRLAVMQAQTAAPAISLGAPRPRAATRAGARPRRTPARELHTARTKFIVLCLILVSLVILLWRSIPPG